MKWKENIRNLNAKAISLDNLRESKKNNTEKYYNGRKDRLYVICKKIMCKKLCMCNYCIICKKNSITVWMMTKGYLSNQYD